MKILLCEGNDMWDSIKEVIETAYYISGIILVMGVVLGLKQLKILKKDLEDRNKRAAVEKSLEYLNLFATTILGAISEFNGKLKKELPKQKDSEHLFDGKFNIDIEKLNKELIVETLVVQKLGATTILNQLEFFSVAMLNGVADENIVFTPASKVYCRFIEEQHLLLSIMRNQGAPYANLVKLYGKWKDRLEVEQLELQKIEAENKIKEKGNSYQAKPPIGF